jgi:SAM-dependent methyltransferase
MEKIVRTHDSFYLDENRYQDPKQLHLEIIGKIQEIEKVSGKTVDSILDAGCAAGEFAYVLQNAFPNSQVTGFDLLPELIAKAKNKVSGCIFFEADIQNSNTPLVGSYDIVTCTGVLSIFDTFEICIKNLISWAKPGGTVFIHSLFNDYPIDVRVQYNLSEDYRSGVLESGWNIFAKETVSGFLKELVADKAIESFTFRNFELKRELPKQADLVRSWTQRDTDGSLQITNGLMLLQPHAILQIKKMVS